MRCRTAAWIAMLLVVAGGRGTWADDGPPVLDAAAQATQTAEEAAARAREAAANQAEAAADAAQENAQRKAREEEQAETDSVDRRLGTVPADHTGSSLTHRLMEDLGVTRAQAVGGAGAIFSAARQRMGPGAFDRVLGAVPGVDALLAEAPGGTDVPGGLGAAVGGFGGKPSLVGPFTQLGMSPDMAGRFLPIVLDYVQSTGGDAAMQDLANAFK